MIIEKRGNCLYVTSGIHIDDYSYFCGRSYISLQACKDSKYDWLGERYIIIAIHDDDDFDIGMKYNPTSDNFEDVLHELINWMHDYEKGVTSYQSIWNSFEFFPYCDCERIGW